MVRGRFQYLGRIGLNGIALHCTNQLIQYMSTIIDSYGFGWKAVSGLCFRHLYLFFRHLYLFFRHLYLIFLRQRSDGRDTRPFISRCRCRHPTQTTNSTSTSQQRKDRVADMV